MSNPKTFDEPTKLLQARITIRAWHLLDEAWHKAASQAAGQGVTLRKDKFIDDLIREKFDKSKKRVK